MRPLPPPFVGRYGNCRLYPTPERHIVPAHPPACTDPECESHPVHGPEYRRDKQWYRQHRRTDTLFAPGAERHAYHALLMRF